MPIIILIAAKKSTRDDFVSQANHREAERRKTQGYGLNHQFGSIVLLLHQRVKSPIIQNLGMNEKMLV